MRARFMGWAVAGAVLVLVGGALAQTAGPAVASGVSAAAPAAAVANTMTLKRVMHDGGSLMWVLVAMSFLTVAFVVYLAAILRASQVVPRFLHREIIEKIRAGTLDDVRRACEYRPCPLSTVVLAAIDYMRSVQDVRTELLKDVMEGEGARQSDALQGQTQYLLDVGVIAPMVGLLGTIFGMLQAFSGVALDVASARPVVLAAGVSKALLTTAFGLIVGIPAMAFYAYFRRRASRMVSMLEVASMDVLAALASKSAK